MIVGETGVGKGVLARWLHEQSDRSNGPLVNLGCAGRDAEYLENELFGYEKLSNGVVTRKAGLFETASGGTVFLDDVIELSSNLQAHLVEMLETGLVRRLGSSRQRPVDVRIVIATNENLAELSGYVHAPLWQRLLTFEIPALRNRPEDISALTEDLLQRLCRGTVTPELSKTAKRALRNHPWPGNIRELKNVLERAIIYSGGRPEILPQDLIFDRLRSNA